jgi:poly(glycerol-phosphate) alpha-glucosyltransferase
MMTAMSSMGSGPVRPRLERDDESPYHGGSGRNKALPLHIAHLTWLLSPAGGGIPPVVLSLAEHQRVLGAAVRVLGVKDPRGTDPAGAELHRPRGPVALGYAPGLARALRDDSTELVHLHGLFTWPSRAACRWGRASGRPVVVAPHGMLDPWALANSAWKKRVYWRLVEDENLRHAACIHALCAAEKKSVRGLGLRRPVAVVPNGVSLPDVAARGPDRRGLEHRVPRLEGRRVLLYLGRIHPKKGLPELLDAWAIVRRERPVTARGWVLVIAGPDQLGHSQVLRRRVDELDLDEDVCLTGALYAEEKAHALRAADAFVLPSRSEGLPMAVLEAMAWGIPVLVTPQCNLDVEGFGGGLVLERDPGSLARGLIEVLSAPDADRRAMGARGRREVESRYTWPLVARQLAEVYRWALGGGPVPAVVCLD